jgi:hypothetical protein
MEISTTTADVDRVDFHVDGVLAGVARQPPWRIAFDFGLTPGARTIRATVWSDGFRIREDVTIVTAGLSANETIDVHLVEVPVRIRSSREVTPADLRVRENGIEQTIKDVRRERPPAHFAFVVDRSLSMTDGKLRAALAAVDAARKHLRDGDTASLVLFNHRVERALPLEHDGAAATFAETTLPSGGTSLRDALVSVASKRRTYAIAITDGGDRNSESSDEEALRAISGTRTIVSAIVMGETHTRFLDRAASNTGGSVMRANASSVHEALDDVLSAINSRHLVIYQSAGTGSGWRKAEVSARARNVRVSHGRKEYFAQ